jgi:putative protease
MKKSPELLLPVGNPEMAMAAIHNGADAVYIGFPGFNARGRTADFDVDQLRQTIETCHLYGVKVNLALNILIFPEELEKVTLLLEKIIPLRPDAFIVQDLGLVRLIREMAPEQVIHASTQMTVTNHEAINLLNDLNIKRFVLGRENSLEEMKLIRAATDKDLEVFVHGALCVSYSGQCFTSESLGGRSANRGQCAQSCRFSYELFVDGNPQKSTLEQRKYLVSPQDLCGINEIPEMMNLGIASFKVEGRLKTPEYVAEVSREYRKVIDSHNQGRRLSGRDLLEARKKMASTYSRGFYPGWLHGVNHQKLVDGTYSAHRGMKIGKVKEVRGSALILQLDDDFVIKSGDGLVWVFKKGHDNIEAGGQVFQAERISGRIWELQFSNHKRMDPGFEGAQVYINSDSELNKDLQKSFHDKTLKKRIPVSIELKISVGEPIRATISDGELRFSTESSGLVDLAQKKALADDFFSDELSALGGTCFSLTSTKIQRSDDSPVFFPHKELKELRRSLTEGLEKLRSQRTIDGFQVKLKPAADVLNWVEDQKKRIAASLCPRLTVLLREKTQVDDVIRAVEKNRLNLENLSAVILDFEFGRDYLESIEKLKALGIRAGIATTRILKPQEYLNLKHIERVQPDIILVRNLGALRYYTEVSPFAGELRGDFSLNVTNHLTIEYLLNKGLKTLCLSYDLNRQQVQELLASTRAEQMEVTVHQYMPSFHMEHCVFAAFLSKGSSFRDCGKPCEKHQIELRDQFGNNHQIKPDQECRNTMYNAVSASAARFIPDWKMQGLGFARFEALRERGEDLIKKIQAYQDLLMGRRTPAEVT